MTHTYLFLTSEILPGSSIHDKLFLKVMKLLIRPRVKPYSLLISFIAACPQSFGFFKKDFRFRKLLGGMTYCVSSVTASLLVPFLTILFLLSLTLSHADSVFAKTPSPAPDFNLGDINGKLVKLSQFRGKAVILNFWSIWCGPCLAEMPSLNKLYLEFKDKGLIVLSIAEDPAEKPVRSYIQEKGIAFPILMDKDRKVYLKYFLFGIPVTFLIDKKGFIAEKFIGERDWSSHEMRGKVLKLLQK
jgi:peroxiredoxin